MYNDCMKDEPKRKSKEGRKSVFSEELGLGALGTYRFPEAVHVLLRDRRIRKHLNWMAMNERYRSKILDSIPAKEPPLPAQLPVVENGADSSSVQDNHEAEQHSESWQ
jgi:hypothetical protein